MQDSIVIGTPSHHSEIPNCAHLPLHRVSNSTSDDNLDLSE